MLLSEWGNEAPSSGCMSQAVLDILKPVLYDMGAGEDPECWVAWGEDPEFKYSVLAPTAAGLVTVAVRLNPGGESGPRATAKLVRWSKLQLGEFAIEGGDGHRVVAVQVEGLVLKGTDDVAGRICEFVRGLMAGADGRAFVATGPVVVQAAPASAPPSGGRSKAATPAGTPSAAPTKGGRKGGRATKPEPGPAPEKEKEKEKEQEQEQELEFVAPHPIAVADEPAPARAPAPAPTPATPAKPVPPAPPAVPQSPAPAPGFGPGQPRPVTREPGSVWEVPAADSAGRDQKKPRTWRP